MTTKTPTVEGPKIELEAVSLQNNNWKDIKNIWNIYSILETGVIYWIARTDLQEY